MILHKNMEVELFRLLEFPAVDLFGSVYGVLHLLSSGFAPLSI